MPDVICAWRSRCPALCWWEATKILLVIYSRGYNVNRFWFAVLNGSVTKEFLSGRRSQPRRKKDTRTIKKRLGRDSWRTWN